MARLRETGPRAALRLSGQISAPVTIYRSTPTAISKAR